MPNNWKTYKLSEITDVITKGTTPSTYGFGFTDDGVNFIKSESTSYDGRLDENAFVKISEEAHEKLKRSQLKENDILFSMAGAYLGKTGIIHKNHLPANTNQANGIIRVNENKALPKFICFLLRNPSLISYVNASAGQSAQPNINLTDIGNLEFNLPQLEEQQSIASILSAIDDKIENNLAINKTLEEMAMALYKHWFVDFGPFKDGEFVESELGLIPKGWEVKTLEYFIEVLSKGTTPRMKDVEGFERKIPFLKVKDINSNGEINLNGLELIPEEIHLKDLKRSILLENDLLFSIAGTIGRVSIVTENLNNSNCNQALAFIRLKEKEKFKSIVYYWLKSDEVQNRIENSVVQGVQANVSLTVLKELKFIKPTNDVIVAFSNKANPILEQVLKNQKENQTLTQLRDTLLPKLISGDVRLKGFREN